MLIWWLALAALGTDPPDVVREAQSAVEAGAAPGYLARWRATLRREPANREARLAIATVARLQYRYADAERDYRILISGPADLVAAAAALGLGQAYGARGYTKPALEWFSRARRDAERLGDAATAVEAAVGVASWRGRSEPALAILPMVDSLPARVRPGEHRLRAIVACSRGHLLSALGRPGARDELRSGASSARLATDPRVEGACLLSLREHFARAGALDSVNALLGDLASALERSRDLSLRAATRQLGGWRLHLFGRNDDARRTLGHALADADSSGNELVGGWTHLGLSALDMSSDNPSDALTHVRAAERLFQRVGDAYGLASSRAVIGSLLANAGDRDGALRQLDSVRVFARSTNRWEMVGSAYHEAARILRREGAFIRSAAMGDSAEDSFRRAGSRTWQAPMQLERASLALRRGDLALARVALDSLLERFHPTQRLPRYEVRVMLAATHARSGEVERAEEVILATTRDLDLWRRTTPDSVLRRSLFAAADRAFDTDISHAYVVARLIAAGRLNPAFELAERRRARELHDRILRRTTERRPAAVEPDAGLDSVRQLLDASTALLSFVTSPREAPSSLIVLTRDGARGHLLTPGDSLDDLATRLGRRLDAGLGEGAIGRELGRRLLDVASGGLPPGVTRLLVVADGALHRVPLEVLRLADGRYVAERYSVWQVPSAAVAMSLIRRAGANARAPMLAMGNPRFPHVGSSSQPGEPPAASAFRDAGGLAPLPAASQEVRALGRTRGATVLEGTAASEAWLKQAALTDYRILHFATHAVVDDWSSARTALALAPGRNEDGFVTLDEIGALRLAADLVVLSACRTAAGVLSHGDGVRGLSTAFLEVGAGAVIATRWSVTDRDAMLFIGAFYAQLADGISIGDALAATKRAAIRRAANPRTWAAFTLVGDGSRRIPPGVRR